jgi:outer membrane autotransporter protein
VPFRSDIGGTWLNVNAGVSARLSRQATLFANLNYDVGFNGDRYAYSGKIGVRMAW